jgi:hypothetical protein
VYTLITLPSNTILKFIITLLTPQVLSMWRFKLFRFLRKITEVMDLIRNRYVFSKVVREVVKHWRGRGLNIIMYLDDGLGGGKHLEYSLATHSAIKSDLERFGFYSITGIARH